METVGVNREIIRGRKAGEIAGFTKLLLGFGVFTTMRTYFGRPFRLEEHCQRLLESAEIIGIKHRFSGRGIAQQAERAFRESRLKEAVIRIFLSGSLGTRNGRLFIVPEKLREYPKENYEKGVGAITVQCERFFPRAKSLSNLPALLALRKAREKGCLEALLVNRGGFATEGATSNLFVVRGNTVATPKENILLGVTRKDVLGLAREEFRVAERSLKKEELFEADEVFLTASIKGIMPLTVIDGKQIGCGKPGEVTRRLSEKFRGMVENECRA
jgi:branched-chain amino acid aminotransferase